MCDIPLCRHEVPSLNPGSGPPPKPGRFESLKPISFPKGQQSPWGPRTRGLREGRLRGCLRRHDKAEVSTPAARPGEHQEAGRWALESHPHLTGPRGGVLKQARGAEATGSGPGSGGPAFLPQHTGLPRPRSWGPAYTTQMLASDACRVGEVPSRLAVGGTM